jgi:hypothetical protein
MSESTSTNGQTAAERIPKRRGIGFPVVGLPEAVTVLRKAGQHGTEYSIPAFATHLGHSTPNSGSFKRRIAAFRDWKLIAGGTGERVVLTDLGRRIAYPTDPVKERRDVQEAFQNCNLFWKVWDDAAKGVPYSLERLANLGVQLGVAPVSKDRFAESLSQSAVAAGFAEQIGERISFISPDSKVPPAVAHEREIDDSIQVTDQGRAVAATAHAAGSAEPVRASVADRSVVTGESGPAGTVVPDRHAPVHERPALLYQQSWEIGGGSLNVEIRLNQSLPAEAFIQLGKVAAEVEKLKALLGEGTDFEESKE